MAKYVPSEQAAAAVMVAEKKIRGDHAEWARMEKHSGYTQEQIKSCAKVFENLIKSIASSSLKAVSRKFKTATYYEVARLAAQSSYCVL